MTGAVEELDLFGAEALRDPDALHHRLRAAGGVVWNRPAGAWVASRYRDVAALLSHPAVAHWTSGRAADPVQDTIGQWMAMLDPRAATALRGLVAPVFAAPAASRLRAGLAILADRLAADAVATGRAEIIADYAEPIAFAALAAAIGLPGDRADAFAPAARAVTERLWQSLGAAGAGTPPEETSPLGVLRALLDDAPPGTLLATLVDRGGGLSESTRLSFLVLFLYAGLDNMVGFIGNAVHALAAAPEQWSRLRGDPALLPKAVTETLRLAGPVQFMTLGARGDIRLGDARIATGDSILAALAAANRDPGHFADPDRLDLDRVAGGHLGFGLGPLGCLGQALARMEGKVALGALLRHARRATVMPPLRLRRGPPVLRGFEALHLTLEG
jgi:cytochrome P450